MRSTYLGDPPEVRVWRESMSPGLDEGENLERNHQQIILNDLDNDITMVSVACASIVQHATTTSYQNSCS